jgi:murein DD-endopeptidase MepM/ murein hydrolase activator NlpD/Tol biopolymer transport system component
MSPKPCTRTMTANSKIPDFRTVIMAACLASSICTALKASAQQPGSIGPWISTEPFPYRIDDRPVAVAFQGRIYVLGGYAAPVSGGHLDDAVHVSTINTDGSLRPWARTTSFAYGRILHGAAINPPTRTIYLIGGAIEESSLTPTNDVQYARLTADGVSSWTQTTPMPSGVSGHSALCYNGYLYVFRGNGQSGSLAQGYFYAPINSDGSVGQWSQGRLSFTRRRYFGAFAYNDHFYIVGGAGGSQGIHPSNQVFTARVPQRSSLSYLALNETEFWQTTAAFQTPRLGHGTAGGNGFAYVTGGEASLGSPPNMSDVQSARILSDGTLSSWQTTTPLPTPLSDHASVVHSGYLYIIGGDAPSGGATAIVRYARIYSSTDTSPPKTQIAPLPGQQPTSTVNVTLTATDIGGSGVATIKRTLDGTDPNTSLTAIVVNSSSVSFTAPTPFTLKFAAQDTAGNSEQTQTASYWSTTPNPPFSKKLRWPLSGPVTQDFYDDSSGLAGGVFYDESNQRLVRKGAELNRFISKSRTHMVREPGVPASTNLHRGVDIAAAQHTAVRPAFAGKATRHDWLNDHFYGNRVVIDHGNGFYTLYAHLHGFGGKLATISNLQSIDVGTADIIGYVGKSGKATGVHLHFEVRHVSDAVGYAQETHFVPVPNNLSVTGGTEIPFDYPGLGGTSLALSQIYSGGLSDMAQTAPALSAAGTLVGYRNSPVYHLVDIESGAIQTENFDATHTQGNGSLFTSAFSAEDGVKAFASDDANLVPFDTNAVSDVFVWTRETGFVELISVSSGGEQANGASYDVALSSDGGVIVFTSTAFNLILEDTNNASDVFIRERAINETRLASLSQEGFLGNRPSYSPSLSADGRHVAFVSEATNLVANDTNGVADIFIRDLQNHTTFLVSKSSAGHLANGPSRHPSISGDGRYIAFESDASNLLPNDSNGFADVFLFDNSTGLMQKLTTGLGGEQSNGGSYQPRISSFGVRVAFTSEASNLSADDTNGLPDIFVSTLRALPALNISFASNEVVLSWPASAGAFALESTTNLNTSAAWHLEPLIFTTSAGENVVTNSTSQKGKFYRLKE